MRIGEIGIGNLKLCDVWFLSASSAMEMLVGTVLHWEALEPHSLHCSKLNLAGQSHKPFLSVVLCLTRFVITCSWPSSKNKIHPTFVSVLGLPLFLFRRLVQKRLAFTTT